MTRSTRVPERRPSKTSIRLIFASDPTMSRLSVRKRAMAVFDRASLQRKRARQRKARTLMNLIMAVCVAAQEDETWDLMTVLWLQLQGQSRAAYRAQAQRVRKFREMGAGADVLEGGDDLGHVAQRFDQTGIHPTPEFGKRIREVGDLGILGEGVEVRDLGLGCRV